MPRIRTTGPESRGPATWQQTVVERIRAGKLAPILSNAVGDDLALGGHAALVEAYAAYSRYPLGSGGLAEMAQFKGITDESVTDTLALKEDYVTFVKSRLFELAEADGAGRDALDDVDAQFDHLTLAQMCDQLGCPRYGDERSHPLLLLAGLDLPIYVTTSYHEFMEAALRRAGKTPRTEFCRWHKEIEKYPSVFDGSYEPGRQEPLVYHLHGLDRYPDSLVLTTDDYLTFLVACAQNFGKNTDPVHGRVRQALCDSSLLLLGYELQGWDFRSLFWGLIVQRTRSLTSVISIQLEPGEVEKLYLQKYLDGYDFKVFWGSVQEYVETLSKAVLHG
jgi:hypothetical protein